MLKKRYLKSIALALVATLSLSMFAPSAALAHRYYRHHRHGWSSGDTWRAIAGVGVLAYIASRAASSSSSPSYQVMDYETYKAEFIRDMDNAESALWLKIKDLELARSNLSIPFSITCSSSCGSKGFNIY